MKLVAELGAHAALHQDSSFSQRAADRESPCQADNPYTWLRLSPLCLRGLGDCMTMVTIKEKVEAPRDLLLVQPRCVR